MLWEMRVREQFGQQVSLEEISPNTWRIYAPYFHEDGDMFSIYLEQDENGSLRLRDFGNTLMRVSYTFDFDTPKKNDILISLVKSNYGQFHDGELTLETNPERLPYSIFQFAQLISKVSSLDILRREVVKSLFFDNLNDFVTNELSDYTIVKDFRPTNDKELVVDYLIRAPKPLYLFAVNENTKASKVVISCLTFQKQRVPFRSLIVHENFNDLSSFYRNQLTNAVDKQYTSLEDFQLEGKEYIERELAS